MSNPSCPMKCPTVEFEKANINTRKLLSLLRIKCEQAPDCTEEGEYWNMLEHESKCKFLPISCPYEKCTFLGSFEKLSEHMMTDCKNMLVQCGFCSVKVRRKKLANHLEEHFQEKTFNIVACSICESEESLSRCICRKSFCLKCITNRKNKDCVKECYIFTNGTNFTSSVYNLSKHKLPKNCEALIYFHSVEWVRTGISFSLDCVNDQVDANRPQYDIYCVLEDLVQLYTKKNGWRAHFKNERNGLKTKDKMKIIVKNNEMRFQINGDDLGGIVKLDVSKDKDSFLFIHCRNPKSKVELIYIREIYD